MRVPNQLKSTLESFTADAARRAIYFDYEGLPTKPPVLLGWYVDGKYAGSIIDRNFAECSYRYKAKAVILKSHKSSVQALLARAFEEERHLVSWSWHDLKFIWPLVPRRQQAAFRDSYVNAIRVARPWYKLHFGPTLRKGEARLKFFAVALGVHIPAKYGEKLVASHLRRLGQALEAPGQVQQAFR